VGKKRIKNMVYVTVIILVVAGMLFFFRGPISGKSFFDLIKGLDRQSGFIEIGFQEGDLVPSDAIISISLDEENRNVTLRKIMPEDVKVKYGRYSVNGVDLGEDGYGYGESGRVFKLDISSLDFKKKDVVNYQKVQIFYNDIEIASY
jgi:hypothetical protein